MKDFFISYNKADKAWAEWIAWILEDAGYTTVIQAWDFRPGSNFAVEMHNAAVEAERTIAVLSPDFLASKFTQPEWAAAFARDPDGRERLLLPVMVRECKPDGLLAQINYIKLIGLAEDDAKAAILGAFTDRGKPVSAPKFPGDNASAAFPGVSASPSTVSRITSVKPDKTPVSIQDRLALVRNLNKLAAQDFNTLLFCLPIPPGYIAPMTAPQAERVNQLLLWAESAAGCGLKTIVDSVEVLIHP